MNKQKEEKVTFNRENLKDFFESMYCDKKGKRLIIEYSNDFYNYFDNDSLSKIDEETGCYVQHLIFQDFPNLNDQDVILNQINNNGLNFDEIKKKGYDIKELQSTLKYEICSFIINYGNTLNKKNLCPRKVNKKGELYLESVIRATDIQDIHVVQEFERSKNYFINIPNHKDYQGNNLLHWIIATGRDPNLFYKFFEYSNLLEKNNYGISVEDIMKHIKSLKTFQNLEINESENYIYISSEEQKDKFNLKYGNNPDYYHIKHQIVLKKNDLLFYLFDGNIKKLSKISKAYYPTEEDFKHYSLKRKK